MPRSDPQQRNRNVAHLWADKRVMRLLRKQLGLDEIAYKNYRAIYIALCEIDSDFSEDKKENSIPRLCSLTKTCAAYAGLSEGITSFYMQQLRKIGLIDYGQVHGNGGKFSSSFLNLHVFDETHIYLKPAPRPRNSRIAEKPYTVKAVYGKTMPIENSTNINISTKKSIEPCAETTCTDLRDKKSPLGKAAKERAASKSKAPNPSISHVVEYFKKQFTEQIGSSPTVKPRDYREVKEQLEAGRTQAELQQLIDWCLAYRKDYPGKTGRLDLFMSAYSAWQIAESKTSPPQSKKEYVLQNADAYEGISRQL